MTTDQFYGQCFIGLRYRAETGIPPLPPVHQPASCPCNYTTLKAGVLKTPDGNTAHTTPSPGSTPQSLVENWVLSWAGEAGAQPGWAYAESGRPTMLICMRTCGSQVRVKSRSIVRHPFDPPSSQHKEGSRECRLQTLVVGLGRLDFL